MATRAELGRLHEGQTLAGVDLSVAEASALNATKLVAVAPDGTGWTVTAAHAVGALRCNDLDVRVTPKVGQVKVLRLLARAHGIRGLVIDESLVGVEKDATLTSVLAVLFAHEATTALAAGPLRGYRTEDQSLNVLRGRLRVRDQELRRFGQLLPLEVTVDEWTADTDENRRIRAAARRLLSQPALPEVTRRVLVRVDRQLADVWLAPGGAQLKPWTATRLNQRVHRLLQLADLVLAHTTVEHYPGKIEVHGFVLRLAWLFEKLVGQLFTEIGGPRRVREQARYDLADRDLWIQPDFVFREGKEVVAVADTKYKILDENGRFANADAYQLVTYCARLGLGIGHLIYAAGESRPEPFTIHGAGIQLMIHAVDLSLDVESIERTVGELYDVISGAALGAASAPPAAHAVRHTA